MKIYTKTGDTGTTSLISGRRISKADLRIEVFGTVDELNSYVGLVRDQSVNENRRSLLKEIQDRLFTIGSHLADDPERHTRKPLPDLQREDVTLIELAIDAMEQELPALRHFVLPGGHPSVSFAHLARTVCRRAERQVVLLSEKAQVEDIIIQYLNRLSDYFFVLSRKMAQELQVEEVKWIPRV